MRPFSGRNGFEIGFWQGAGDHSMHVKLAYAVSVAAPVAMLAGCSKKSDDGAGRKAAVFAAPPASGVRVAGTGRAAPSVRRIAQLGKDKDNGARLTIEDINALGLTIGRTAGAQAASRQTAGRDVTAAMCAARRMPASGHAQMSPSPLHFNSTTQRGAATDRVTARNPICPGAGLASLRTGKGSDAGQPDDGRFGMLPYDFKEATTTVLDVVTI
ncbi:amino acid-binding protein [Burkholderia stabilis]|uniref:amino acid-binding protein n=2 Tax=Burkholderia stabilis TaxID=95485 RepID=UPI0015885F49|nr:amino acid-binding protein [Burkholderia stabilis]